MIRATAYNQYQTIYPQNLLAVDGGVIHEEAHCDRRLAAKSDEAAGHSKVENSHRLPVDLHLIDTKLFRSTFDERADFEGREPLVNFVVCGLSEVGVIVLNETIEVLL